MPSRLKEPPRKKRAALWLPMREEQAQRLRWVCFLLYPLLAFLLVEMQAGLEVFSREKPLLILLNLGFYYTVAGLLWLVLGRAKLAGCITLSFFWLFGLVNCYVTVFRGRPVVAGDLLTLGTAVNVAGNYSYAPAPAQWQSGMICLGLLLAAFLIPPQKGRSPWKLIPALPVGLACAVFLLLFFPSPFLDDAGVVVNIWQPSSDGAVLHFMLSARDLIGSPPAGYSPAAARRIRDGLPDSVTAFGDASAEIQPTNIIVVMNESFADLSALGELETNMDPLPFYHSLTENTIKGTAYASVFGGTTANSEYEFLTGHTTAFLPVGSVPYHMYVKPKAASLVSQMKALGYTTEAMHPFYSSGWDRVKVYSHFGFDNVRFYEDYEDVAFLRVCVDDASNYREVIRVCEEKEAWEKFFCFNITMQNHGPYDLEWNNLEKEVWLTGDMEDRYPTVDQYLNLAYQSDRALEELIGHFSQSEEPTLILFFGDHQPKVDGAFFDEMLGENLDAETAQRKQAVPFLIWANYPIPERQGVEISLNYLSALLMDVAGLPMTGYQRFLLESWKTLPVLNAVGCADSQGNWYPGPDQLTGEAQTLVQNYRILQYNELFDSRSNLLSDFFFLPDP